MLLVRQGFVNEEIALFSALFYIEFIVGQFFIDAPPVHTCQTQTTGVRETSFLNKIMVEIQRDDTHYRYLPVCACGSLLRLPCRLMTRVGAHTDSLNLTLNTLSIVKIPDWRTASTPVANKKTLCLKNRHLIRVKSARQRYFLSSRQQHAP